MPPCLQRLRMVSEHRTTKRQRCHGPLTHKHRIKPLPPHIPHDRLYNNSNDRFRMDTGIMLRLPHMLKLPASLTELVNRTISKRLRITALPMLEDRPLLKSRWLTDKPTHRDNIPVHKVRRHIRFRDRILALRVRRMRPPQSQQLFRDIQLHQIGPAQKQVAMRQLLQRPPRLQRLQLVRRQSRFLGDGGTLPDELLRVGSIFV